MKISITIGGYYSDFGKIKFMKETGWDAVDLPLTSYLRPETGVFADIQNTTDEMLDECFTPLRKEAERVGLEFGQTHSWFDGTVGKQDMEDIFLRVFLKLVD